MKTTKAYRRLFCQLMKLQDLKAYIITAIFLAVGIYLILDIVTKASGVFIW